MKKEEAKQIWRTSLNIGTFQLILGETVNNYPYQKSMLEVIRNCKDRFNKEFFPKNERWLALTLSIVNIKLEDFLAQVANLQPTVFTQYDIDYHYRVLLEKKQKLDANFAVKTKHTLQILKSKGIDLFAEMAIPAFYSPLILFDAIDASAQFEDSETFHVEPSEEASPAKRGRKKVEENGND